MQLPACVVCQAVAAAAGHAGESAAYRHLAMLFIMRLTSINFRLHEAHEHTHTRAGHSWLTQNES